MKNIFVLPSDKPSRLAYDFDEKCYYLQDNVVFFEHQDLIENRNIYITNSEEIKEDTKPCWCINTIKNTWNDDLIYYQGAMPQYHYIGFKKIILTTNPELIKNGVQELDETFLNWFVSKANDSGKPIDIVEVRKESRCCGLCNGIDDLCFSDRYCEEHNELGCEKCFGTRVNYKPIIPTQEQKQDLHFAFDVPKQETIDEVAKDLNYWKNNAEEDYLQVPISVLRYISELEKAIEVEYAQHKKQ